MSNETGSAPASGDTLPPPIRVAASAVRALCRPAPLLSPNDPLARAVEALRLSPLGSLPIATSGRVLALVSEADLARIVLASGDDTDVRLMPLQLFLPALAGLDTRGALVTLHQATPLTVAANIFRERPDLSVIPIQDDRGLYMGLVSRADLMAALCKTLAPPRVGGMATPLGVYLTDGVEAGGAGNAALFLTGICLSTLYFAALLLAALFVTGLHRWTHTDLDLAYLSFLARHTAGLGNMALVDLRTTLSFPLMLILLRMVPISGYHAAEHQVVHCIERGEPLLPQIVARMPRPHPRCGTNFVAAFTLLTLFLVFFTALAENIEVGLMAAVVATLALWRWVGSFLQQYLTTRRASPRQIESGIRAGEEILAKYRRGVNRPGRFFLRVWRMGVLQILAGSSIVLGIMWVLTDLFPAFSRLIGSF